MEDLTRNEAIRYSYLFALNYSKDDLRNAFSESHLGADYFLEKWQEYINNERTYTLAYFDLFFALDPHHANMLNDYIFIKYKETIKKARLWDFQINEAEKQPDLTKELDINNNRTFKR